MAQTAPTPTDSLIRVQLEVVPFPASPLAPRTAISVFIVPATSLNCPMPVAGGNATADSAMAVVPAPGAPAVPMPGAGARGGSYCTNPLRPRPAVLLTP